MVDCSHMIILNICDLVTNYLTDDYKNNFHYKYNVSTVVLNVNFLIDVGRLFNGKLNLSTKYNTSIKLGKFSIKFKLFDPIVKNIIFVGNCTN